MLNGPVGVGLVSSRIELPGSRKAPEQGDDLGPASGLPRLINA
jgi:hypothetical protein